LWRGMALAQLHSIPHQLHPLLPSFFSSEALQAILSTFMFQLSVMLIL
jgi:hypothetical protein